MAFDRAVKLKKALEDTPQDSRKKPDYTNVIWACRTVYHLDPSFGKTPVALEYVAELYEEMGRVFSDKQAFQTSIGAYEFLMKEYPQSTLARDALLAVAEIYRTDLADPVQAQKKYREYLALHPKSEKAADARAAIKDLQRRPVEVAAQTTVPQDLTAEGPTTGDAARPGKLLEVTGVRRWVGPNYTRIVISVNGEVGFDASRLVSPDRLVFDLSNSRPSQELMGKTFPFEGGFLHQIRIAQYRPTVTRVVLDVAHIEDFSVFSLPNPFRLVIDIHGPVPSLVAKDQSKKPGKTAAATPTVGEGASGKDKSSRKANASPETGTSKTTTAAANVPAAETTGPKPDSVAEDEAGDSPAKTPKKGKDKPVVAEDNAPPIKIPPPTEAGARTLTRALGLKIGRIVIDPGHGGHDTGTIGPTGVMEKDVVLEVGLRLARLLEQAGSEVVMTRHDDTFIPLEERTAIANEKDADLFISIHANASRDHSARGIETYYLNFNSNPEALEVAARENATSQQSVHELRDLIKKIALTEKVEESRDFASEVQHEVHSRLVKASGKQKDRGVKKAPFVVLIGANMPSILAEISFLTNPKDERLLKQPEYLQKIAQALDEGIIHYVNNLGGVRVAQAGRTPRRVTGDAAGAATGRELNSPNTPNF